MAVPPRRVSVAAPAAPATRPMATSSPPPAPPAPPEGRLHWTPHAGDARAKGGKDKAGWGELPVAVLQ